MIRATVWLGRHCLLSRHDHTDTWLVVTIGMPSVIQRRNVMSSRQNWNSSIVREALYTLETVSPKLAMLGLHATLVASEDFALPQVASRSRQSTETNQKRQ